LKTNTKYFGEIEYEEEEILTFPQGIFAFEGERRFLLLPFAGSDRNLLCLQSLEEPSLAFIVLDPFSLDPDYAPTLQPDELKLMGVENSHDLYYYVMCVVRDPVGESTVNMRCPVVINGDTCKGAQVILEDETYQMRHLLSEFGKEETPC